MLPPALLDLLSHRLVASSNVFIPPIQAIGYIRHVQQLAAQHQSPILDGYKTPMLVTASRGTRTTRDGYSKRKHQAQMQVEALSELETRVSDLKDASVVSKMEDHHMSEGPHLLEAELQDIYKDLLSSPEVDKTPIQELSNTDVKIPQLQDLILTLEERLTTFETAVDSNTAQTGLSSRLLARMRTSLSATGQEASNVGLSQHGLLLENGSSLRKMLNRLRSVIHKMDSNWRIGVSESTSDTKHVPFGMLSNIEWGAFLQAFLTTEDGPASESVLDLMKRSGLIPSDEQYDSVLNLYAAKGLVEEADEFISRMAIYITTDRQRDLLIKARVKAKRLDDACALLHSFEKEVTPAPMQSYTRVIQALFSQRGPGSEQQKAQAWDMFSHMRYVAHVAPDEFLYTVMIRACAESTEPEPERALDLFTEMTVDKQISPTTYAYNAVILTCARSKKFALQAFRLAREMLNSHRDAYGEIPPSLRPDKATFCALLEAAKRMGDLPRARWILAQMTSGARNLPEGERPVYIDERVMTHVFHTYASYRPPFRRDAVSFVQGEEEEDPASGPDESVPEDRVELSDLSNRPGVPQSRQEIVKEVTVLWERILEDRRDFTAGNQTHSSLYLVFGHVSLTSALLNAYLAVHYIHSPPSAAYKVYANLFEPLGLRRDAFTYVLALEAYAQGRRVSKEELRVALSVARNVWNDWRQLEDLGVSQLANQLSSEAVDARLVERAWSGMMKLLTINNHLDEAIDLLHQFVDRYPPVIIKQPSPSDPKRSTRTSLYADRPIVRLTERSAVPEDRIPPFLTFRDLNLLHQRAIAAKRQDYISFITWVGKAYEGALRRRREGTLRPAGRDHRSYA